MFCSGANEKLNILQILKIYREYFRTLFFFIIVFIENIKYLILINFDRTEYVSGHIYFILLKLFHFPFLHFYTLFLNIFHTKIRNTANVATIKILKDIIPLDNFTLQTKSNSFQFITHV